MAIGCVFFKGSPQKGAGSCWFPFKPTKKGVPSKTDTPNSCSRHLNFSLCVPHLPKTERRMGRTVFGAKRRLKEQGGLQLQCFLSLVQSNMYPEKPPWLVGFRGMFEEGQLRALMSCPKISILEKCPFGEGAAFWICFLSR